MLGRALALGCAVLLFAPVPASAGTSGFAVELAGMRDGDTAPERMVYNGFGCTGGNRSPALRWHDAPSGTQSYAVTIHDPDAPTGSGWWHWLLFNLPATTTQLPEGYSGSTPADPAIESITDFGKPGYGGPCPPPGDRAHRYVITVYALKTAGLPLDAKAMPAMVGFMLGQNSLAKATVTLRYARPAVTR